MIFTKYYIVNIIRKCNYWNIYNAILDVKFVQPVARVELLSPQHDQIILFPSVHFLSEVFAANTYKHLIVFNGFYKIQQIFTLCTVLRSDYGCTFNQCGQTNKQYTGSEYWPFTIGRDCSQLIYVRTSLLELEFGRCTLVFFNRDILLVDWLAYKC